MSDNKIFRHATINDIRAIVALHIKAFPTHFMSQLGPNFVSYYYKTVILSENGMIFVAEEKANVLGFISVLTNPLEFYTELKKKILVKPGAMIKYFFMNVRNFRSVARRFLRINRSSRQHYVGYEISSIATKTKRSGTGDFILSELRHHLKRHSNIECIYLRTDFNNENKSVIRFYERNGFEMSNIEMDMERPMIVLHCRI